MLCHWRIPFHRTHSFFEERPRRRFLVEVSDKLGVPKRDRGKLARGETVVLGDGERVTPAQVLGEPQAGCKIVYMGDTAFDKRFVSLCRNATCLICEATYLGRDKALAGRYKHLTAREAATLAEQGGVGGLVVNHFSNRYDVAEIAEEVYSVFPDAIMADDLRTVQVSAAGGVRVAPSGDDCGGGNSV